ncbi:MAG: RNA polymerase sigma factor [Planctomycetota bacterium]
MKCPDVYSSEGTASGTSSQLLREAQLRRQDAWQQLVQTYSRRMYRWCRQAGLQPADAANVVQEAFESVARKLGDFRRDRPGGTFRGWLRRIVENKIRDHFRRQGRQCDLAVGGTDAHQFLVAAAAEPAAEAAEPAAELEPEIAGDAAAPVPSHVQSTIDAVREAVGQRNWLLFWRTAVDGQSAADVGAEFGVSANAVRLAKMRVLRRLRERFGDQIPHPYPLITLSTPTP